MTTPNVHLNEDHESVNSETPKQIGKFATIEDFTKEGFAEIIQATKATNAFPQGTARDLYCSYPSYGRIIDKQSHRILGLISKVLKWQNVKGNIERRQPDEQFEMLLECNDAILERLGSNLDELAGIKKNPQTIIVESTLNPQVPCVVPNVGKGAGSWNTKRTDASANKNTTLPSARLITAKNIARPQISFALPIDNSSITPFMPRLKDKPNSIKPLAILPEYDDTGAVVSYLHPYEIELVKFTVPVDQLKPITPQTPKDVNSTELVYVDTVPKLKAAIEELRLHKAIGVDVEHHSYRSFLGLTCLVQISSIEKDYIFDTLELREDMNELNLIFTDPNVVKIFHGSDSDIEWLQRDLSLYVVNMFDTHQAAKTLNFARLSLAYLLKHFCNLELDKSFQLADWRMRPLPKDLLEYARRDTHYLIYAYQCLTNELIKAGNQNPKLLSLVYQRCTELCKKRYQKPTLGVTAHVEMCRKAKRVFDNRQMYALEQILQWRDEIARREDESCGYVLPNHMMLQISESLPREMQGILACCNPIPPLVRQHLHTLHQIVLHAREQPLVKPILEPAETSFRDSGAQQKFFNEKLHSSLDTSHDDEFRDDLPVLLRFDDDETIVNESPIYSVSSCPAKLTFFAKKIEDEILKPDLTKLLLPYQRFLAYLPFAEQEKLAEAERLEAAIKARRLCPAAPEIMNIKTEVDSGKQNQNQDDDLYKMPIRDMIKRKHEESASKKIAAERYSDSPKPKRFKADKQKNRSQNKKQWHLKSKNISDVEVIDLDSTIEDGAPIEIPIVKKPTAEKHAPEKKRQKFKNKNRSKRQEQPKTQQPSKSTVKQQQQNQQPSNSNTTTMTTKAPKNEATKNFDYKNVNFKKFSGGAKRVQGIELKTQHRNKNNSNKNNNKKFNKLFTFSNAKGYKK